MNPIKTELTHEQVFGHLKHESFTTEEAAQYLEVSELTLPTPTFSWYVQSGKLKPAQVVGRSQLFATSDLRRLKQKLS